MLYEEYRQAGQLLEKAIRERRNGSALKDRSELVKLLEGLNLRNYNFTEAGLSAILSGRFGSDLTPAQPGSAVTPPRADVGAQVPDS